MILKVIERNVIKRRLMAADWVLRRSRNRAWHPTPRTRCRHIRIIRACEVHQVRHGASHARCTSGLSAAAAAAAVASVHRAEPRRRNSAVLSSSARAVFFWRYTCATAVTSSSKRPSPSPKPVATKSTSRSTNSTSAEVPSRYLSKAEMMVCYNRMFCYVLLSHVLNFCYHCSFQYWEIPQNLQPNWS